MNSVQESLSAVLSFGICVYEWRLVGVLNVDRRIGGYQSIFHTG